MHSVFLVGRCVLKCRICDRENKQTNRFCIYCGSLLFDESLTSQSDNPSITGTVEPSVAKELLEIQRLLKELTGRVDTFGLSLTDKSLGITDISHQITPEEADAAPSELNSGRDNGPYYASQYGNGKSMEIAGSTGSGHTSLASPVARSIDWERILGLNWLAIVGVVSLVIGVGFFLGLALQNNWIGEKGRFMLAVATGLTLIAAGEYFRFKAPTWSRSAIGGGISILHMSNFALIAMFDGSIVVATGYFLEILVVLLGGLLALRYNSKLIAILSLLGAFFYPILVFPSEEWLFLIGLYVIIVDAGILLISSLRNWPWFTLTGLVASYLVTGAWIGLDSSSVGLLTAELSLIGVFLIFVGATTLFHIIWKREPGRITFTLMTLNAVFFYGETVSLIWNTHQAWAGSITLALSVFYGLFAYIANRIENVSPRLALFSVAIGFVFVTIAIPIQFTDGWVTIAWVAEGVTAIWIGFILRNEVMRIFGLGVLALASVVLLMQTPFERSGFTPIFNGEFLVFGMAISGFYLSAYIYSHYKNLLELWETNNTLSLVIAANAFTLWILSAEAITYFDISNLSQSNNEIGVFSLTVIWSMYSTFLILIAMARKSRELRLGSVVISTIAIAKFVLVDSILALDTNVSGYIPLGNFFFITYLVLVINLISSSYIYLKSSSKLDGWETQVMTGLIIGVNVTTLSTISIEVLKFFQGKEILLDTSFASPMHFSLTSLWALYFVLVILTGIYRASSRVRLVGLISLGIPVFKLYLYDVFLLDPLFRVIAFVSLGILLLTTGLLYQSRGWAIKGFLFDRS